MSLFVIILGLLPGLLGNIPGISPKIKQIIADVTGSTEAILSSGAVSQPSINTVLAAWLGIVNALKADPSLPATALSALGQIEKIVQSVLVEDQALAKSVDWSKFQPITPVA